jgi:hypothetical protein
MGRTKKIAGALVGLALAGGCGGTVTDGTGGAGGGGGAPTSTSTSTDPCAGKSCGDPCTSCPDQAPCAQQACDMDGQCVVAPVQCGGCPSEPPPDGAACSPPGLFCEVEGGIIVECRATATCTTDGWLNQAPGCSSTPPPDPKCPMMEPSGACDVATDPSLCVYGDDVCGCSDCLGGPCGGQAEWVCVTPPRQPCPATPPKIGNPCPDEGASCIYGSCSLTYLAGRVCQGGLWADDGVACPL